MTPLAASARHQAIDPKEVAALIRALKQLPLDTAVANARTWYSCLPYCILAAVFSINARYSVIRQMLLRYGELYGYPPLNVVRLPRGTREPTVSEFIRQVEKVGPERFAKEVLRNRMLTSTTNGILKAEAALDFAHVLAGRHLERKADVLEMMRRGDAEALETDLRKVHGQRSGIAVSYFFMNVGDPLRVKVDRWMLRFFHDTLRREVRLEEPPRLLLAAALKLRSAYPGITPRALDRLIWVYETGANRQPAQMSRASEIDRLGAQINRIEQQVRHLHQRLARLEAYATMS